MNRLLIRDARIINEGEIFQGSVLVENDKIAKIFRGPVTGSFTGNMEVIEAAGRILIPGIIDDQVHFREPGLTHKADIYTEAKAGIAGGVTSFMEMPNTVPQATTQKLLEDKYEIASRKSLANYSFYMGTTNDNLEEILKTDPKTVCGIKIFMGSSTGNMLVDNPDTLESIFRQSPMLIAVHCEDEKTIQSNLAIYKEKYGDQIPVEAHPEIRSAEACRLSSSMAVALAQKHQTRLHLLHLSTAAELSLLDNTLPLSQKRITGEVCVHHLWFNSNDYSKFGNRIKWNPAIKTEHDRQALFDGLLNDTLDVIATDHAPHTLEEKQRPYTSAPSGGPLVQHSFNVMLEFYQQGKISLEKIVQKMSHHPAELFRIDRRGYIREGYYADLVLVNLSEKYTVSADNVLYKCKWSPFEGHTFTGKVTHTLVNGNLVFENGKFNETQKGKRLEFNR